MSLRDHYLRTTYRVAEVDPPIDMRIGEPCRSLDALLDKHNAHCWAFVTAWNPASVRLPDAENRVRQEQLETEMQQAGYRCYRGVGLPDQNDWKPEVSILIVGLAREEAVAVGKRHGQIAIVLGTAGGNAELLFTSEGAKKQVLK